MADINSSQNQLSSDVQIKGNLLFTEALVFDGKLEGEIMTDGQLTLGPNAVVNGDVVAGSVIVFGRVVGNITASDRCELKSKAHLEGDLRTARLQIEEGATFVGRSEVNPQRSTFSKPEVFRPEKGADQPEAQPQQQAKGR
jgi:cytoskeletal protein CcmA (bactofilin family)